MSRDVRFEDSLLMTKANEPEADIDLNEFFEIWIQDLEDRPLGSPYVEGYLRTLQAAMDRCAVSYSISRRETGQGQELEIMSRLAPDYPYDYSLLFSYNISEHLRFKTFRYRPADRDDLPWVESDLHRLRPDGYIEDLPEITLS